VTLQQPTFNQSTNIVTIETEGGLMGIGEGGDPDTMQQCAGMLIGEDPFRIEHLWQTMFRGYFYPAGHEKQHALGALDLAMWDLKGKAWAYQWWQLLGGKSRTMSSATPPAIARPQAGRWKTRRALASPTASALFAMPSTGAARWIASNALNRYSPIASC